jgi:hypothetical protein
LGSPAGLAAEATVCAQLLQTVARGDNLALEDQLRAHDLLQPLPLLVVSLRTRTDSATTPPAVGSDITAHPTAMTTDLATCTVTA